MKGIVSIFLFVFMIFGSTALGQYKMMVSNNYPPYHFINDEGEITGFDIDILKAINKIHDNQIHISSGNWEDVLNALDSGEVDAAAGIHYQTDTDNIFHYTRSVINAFHTFFYNKDIHQDLTFEDIRIAHKPKVVLWSNGILKQYMLSLNPNAEFIFVESYVELFRMLQREDVTCAITLKNTGEYYIRKFGFEHIATVNKVFMECIMGFKVRRDKPELVKLLNNGLEIIMANGTYQLIYDKWMKDYNQHDSRWKSNVKDIVIGIVIIGFIIALLLVFNWILNRQVQIKTTHLEEQLKLNSIIRQELEVEREKAEVSDKFKSSFLANMSHEIRTPMNGILGFSELLKSAEYGSEEQIYFIDLIQKSGARMLSTINNIIDISKIESGAEKLILKDLNLRSMIHEIVDFFCVEVKEKEIRLFVEEGECIWPCHVRTDEYKLHSILTNLLKNAIKFTNEGSVTIGYSTDESFLNFFIKDTGIGISKDKQEVIFRQFVRADISYSSEFEGSGLGLSIAREYVRMLGGIIWLESEPGKGSVFFIKLPLRELETKTVEHEELCLRDL